MQRFTPLLADAARLARHSPGDRWHVDETYAKVAGGPGEAAFEGVAEFDQRVVDGAVNGVGGLAKRIGDGLRPMQTGLIRTYALGVAVGAALLLTYVVTRMSI